MKTLALMIAIVVGTPTYTTAEPQKSRVDDFEVTVNVGDTTNPIEVAYSVTLTLEGAEETFANQIVGCRDHPTSPEWDMVFIGENLKSRISPEEAHKLLDQAIEETIPKTPRSPERGVFLLIVTDNSLLKISATPPRASPSGARWFRKCAYLGREDTSLLRLSNSPSLILGLGTASPFSPTEENMLRRSSPDGRRAGVVL